jgi:hypothetical protein
MSLTVQDKFLSQDNKRLLWELMIAQNIFQGISDTYINNVKTDFERTLAQKATTIQARDDILSLNKQVLFKMVEEVKKYIQLPVTSEEVLTKKQEKFQRGLASKQEEFNTLIQPPKPPVIDFTDKLDDEPIGSEMDIKLAQTIAWREKQLSQVLEKQDTTQANDWIKNGIQATHGDTIKIGESTNIDDIINVKKVSFSDREAEPMSMQSNSMQSNSMQSNSMPSNSMQSNSMPSNSMQSNSMQSNNTPLTFMDKLKKKDIYEEISSVKTDIKILLTQHKLILENQEKILHLLAINNKIE